MRASRRSPPALGRPAFADGQPWPTGEPRRVDGAGTGFEHITCTTYGPSVAVAAKRMADQIRRCGRGQPHLPRRGTSSRSNHS
ncbi:hypothetical protein CgIS1_12655 [Frankia sp. CgS1]|nr:hypothetical protein Manayef4_19545 [Frankia sp. CgIM4]OHV54392.1 hypothetical protein CgIS1_12655 [Frankia sp. CgIS1]